MKSIIRILLFIFLIFNISYGDLHRYVDKPSYMLLKTIKYNAKRIFEVVNDLDDLTYEQLLIMEYIYRNSKDFNLEYTCLAIAYKESRYEDYLLNPETGDYGLMGINFKTFLNTYIDYKISRLNKIKLISKLIKDRSFNLSVAIENLNYWRSIYGEYYPAVWGSYNGGWKPSKYYAEDIMNIKKAIKIWLNKNPGKKELILGKR